MRGKEKGGMKVSGRVGACMLVDSGAFSAFCITDYSSRGNRYYHILGGCAVEFSALAVFTVLSDEFMLIAECK
jgi:hypothetical protein